MLFQLSNKMKVEFRTKNAKLRLTNTKVFR